MARVKPIRFKAEIIIDQMGVSTEIMGDNVAEIMSKMPETLNHMLQHLATAREQRDERKAMQKAPLVRQDAGGVDAGAEDQREGYTVDLTDLRPPEDLEGPTG
ncbi:MAG TPA: hypothetical protein VNH18_00340 [Bryobacteraceae bacterium]|jgi:hypothetical protein|nr:hypothetical protein [Bryobacteraceae bacterium]